MADIADQNGRRRVLFLGRGDSLILCHLVSHATLVGIFDGPPSQDMLDRGADLVVVHGYRHKIAGKYLDAWRGRAVNCHISLLPFCRGADPCLWGWVEEAPHGVSMHVVDEGIDTGAIVAQRVVALRPTGTLRTSYAILQAEMADLFAEVWQRFLLPDAMAAALPQLAGGSFHRMRDRSRVPLTHGWDTPVADVIAIGDEMREAAAFWERAGGEGAIFAAPSPVANAAEGHATR